MCLSVVDMAWSKEVGEKIALPPKMEAWICTQEEKDNAAEKM